MSVASVIKKSGAKLLRKGPLWEGPEGQGPQGGITQSLVARWLECRERFQVRYLEGWQGNDQFQKALQYGQMWHTCEEALAAGWSHADQAPPVLSEYCKTLIAKYPTQTEEVDHWYRTCKAQFPVYVDYWAKHPDVEQRTPLMQEQVFDVPYRLPSGRVVRLRGKFDSVDLIGKGKGAGIWLQENKTKGDVDEQRIKEQLHFDLQTMLYIIALGECGHMVDREEFVFRSDIKGVRYNVIRRPFSGGRGTIKRNPAKETKDEFYQRLTDTYFKAEPEYWFMRWKSEVSPADVARFRKDCLDPLLEAICWWYDCQNGNGDESERDYGTPNFHWRHPFGVRNMVDEGYGSDVDRYIETGSIVGLTKTDTLFPELT